VISTKFTSIVAVAAFVSGSFIASPELRAYAANTVFSTDIVDGQVKTADLGGNSVTAAKIKDGEVKAAEIASDSVGGSELIGVTKLLFGQCVLTSSEYSTNLDPGIGTFVTCTISGVDNDDSAVATFNDGNSCIVVARTATLSGEVHVAIRNACPTAQTAGAGSMIAVIVYDK